MHKVKLLTNTGQFVTEVELPPFLVAPEVIIWGDRAFKQTGDSVYSEVFCYAVPIIGG